MPQNCKITLTSVRLCLVNSNCTIHPRRVSASIFMLPFVYCYASSFRAKWCACTMEQSAWQ